jgi:hypothetical protein
VVRAHPTVPKQRMLSLSAGRGRSLPEFVAALEQPDDAQPGALDGAPFTRSPIQSKSSDAITAFAACVKKPIVPMSMMRGRADHMERSETSLTTPSDANPTIPIVTTSSGRNTMTNAFRMNQARPLVSARTEPMVAPLASEAIAGKKIAIRTATAIPATMVAMRATRTAIPWLKSDGVSRLSACGGRVLNAHSPIIESFLRRTLRG